MSKTLTELIRDELGLNKQVNESYVTQAKKYDLRTELLSKKTKEEHQKLLEGYVEALNNTSVKLDTVELENVNPNHSEFGNLKREEAWNMNAAYLHALYFDNISDLRSVITMDSLAFMRIERDFGNFDKWQKEFVACGLASRNGWAVMGYSFMLKRYINIVIDLHDGGIPVGFVPCIVLDCWEHAYYRDYLTDRKTYIYGMMKEFDWKTIEERMMKAEKMAKIQ
jgi:Fe-Mn family superoxide dismutase